MCKTIKQKVKFKADPQTVYELLSDSKKHTAFSGKPAKIAKEIGGRFSTFGGFVTGIIVDLLPGKRIVQAWRGADFPAGVFSMATFNLSPTRDGGTELTLIHRGVPKELIPGVEESWREFCWSKMKEYLAKS